MPVLPAATTTSQIPLSSTITWAKSFVGNLDPTVMANNEPAITNANLIKMVMLGPPFTWLFNRVTTGFIATVGVQDYYVLCVWPTNVTLAVNTLLMDSNGNSQQVTTGGLTGTSLPTWNPTLNGTTTDGAVTWTNLGPIAGTSSSYNHGYIETASVQDISFTPARWFEISQKECLSRDSAPGRPANISAQKDDGLGNITFRLMPVPDKAYPVAVTMQQKAATFTNTAAMWAPIPDQYSYIYNWGFLALTMLYADDPKWPIANQKFMASLLAAQQGLTEIERNIFLNNWEAITGQSTQNSIRMSQGNQARGV